MWVIVIILKFFCTLFVLTLFTMTGSQTGPLEVVHYGKWQESKM